MNRKSNFVEPGPAPAHLVRIEPEPWPQAPQLPEVANARQTLTGTPVDTAAGFAIAYTPIAVSAALVASVVAAVAGGSAAAVAVATLATLGVTWLVGYVAQAMLSAAGVDLVRVLLTYRLLRHEQRRRHAERGKL